GGPLHVVARIGQLGVLEPGDPAGEVRVGVHAVHLLGMEPGGEVEGTDRLPQRAGGPAVGDGDIPLDERRHAVPAGPGGDVLAQRVEAVDGPGGGLELVEHELRVAQDHLGGIDGQLLLGVAAGGVVEDVAAAGGQDHRVEAGAGQGGEVRLD